MTARYHNPSVYGFLYKTAVGDNRSHASGNARSIPSSTTEFIRRVKRGTGRGRASNPRRKSGAWNILRSFYLRIISYRHLALLYIFSALYLAFLVYMNVLCNMENARNFYTRLYCQEWRKGKKMEINVIVRAYKSILRQCIRTVSCWNLFYSA